MSISVDFGAKLVQVTSPPDRSREIVLCSSGTTLQLHPDSNPQPVFTVVDRNGSIVRSVHAWLSHLRRQVGLSVAPRTRVGYGRALTYFCRWLEIARPYPNLSIDDALAIITRGDITEWLNYMQANGAGSLKTVHMREVAVRQFLDWLTTIEGGRIREEKNSPWGSGASRKYISSVPSPNSPKFLPTELICSLLSGFHNECERCMFHSQYDMGLRIEELTKLVVRDLPNVDQYNPKYQFIPVSISGNKGTAGHSKPRITLVSRAVLQRIKRYHSSIDYRLADGWAINDPDKPWFLTVNSAPWGVRNASKQFKAAVRRQGIDDRFCTHWMRHGTAFSVLRSDVGKTVEDRLLVLQQMLGHANLSTTQIYTQISPAMLVRLTEHGREIDRLDEAEEIRKLTFLGPNQHRERRGHHA